MNGMVPPASTRAVHLRSVALEIADRLADLEFVERESEPRFRGRGRGLSGDAGMALFFAAALQARESSRYREALHGYMKAAATSRTAPQPGLFNGYAGLLVACQYARSVEPRYATLRDQCASACETSIMDRRQPFVPASSMADYDVITGRAGEALAYAYAAPQLLEETNAYLAWLLEDQERWRCVHPVQKQAGRAHDLGLAHGLSGIIAALAQTPKFEHALQIGVATLGRYRGAGGAIGWPASVVSMGGPRQSRSAWCYGAPGTASALVLAATRLNDARHASIAHEVLRELTHAPLRAWDIPDFALCHGHMGNALILWALGHYFEDEAILRVALGLVDIVLNAFDESLPFGYRAYNVDLVNAPGILQGAAGIALGMLTIARLCDPGWLTAFAVPTTTLETS